MSETAGARAVAAPAGRSQQEQLRRMSNELEGIFLRQLLEAMRQSVPNGGLTGASAGEDLFTSLLDDRLASEAAARTRNGIGEALYRQLSRRLIQDVDPSSQR